MTREARRRAGVRSLPTWSGCKRSSSDRRGQHPQDPKRPRPRGDVVTEASQTPYQRRRGSSGCGVGGSGSEGAGGLMTYHLTPAANRGAALRHRRRSADGSLPRPHQRLDSRRQTPRQAHRRAPLCHAGGSPRHPGRRPSRRRRPGVAPGSGPCRAAAADLREAAGLNQIQLAAASGLTHEAISRLETGHYAPYADTVRTARPGVGG